MLPPGPGGGGGGGGMSIGSSSSSPSPSPLRIGSSEQLKAARPKSIMKVYLNIFFIVLKVLVVTLCPGVDCEAELFHAGPGPASEVLLVHAEACDFRSWVGA